MEDLDFNESGYESPTKKPRSDKTQEYINIHDNVHDTIEVHPLCRKIMDTPQFARLRNVKQLGCCFYVYPTATHTRFQHSLGVMHLAGQYYNHLVASTPDLKFDPVDHLCVQVAGLIHDIGHGPFSHLWEQFVSEANPKSGWTHEKASLDMFDFLIESNDIPIPMVDWNIKAQDVDFIKELVVGPLGGGSSWPYKGRGREKAFLYEIIANHECGVDVDKMDYLFRDARGLGLNVAFQKDRLFHNALVDWDNSGKSFISFRMGEDNVVALFMDRSRLHDQGYQHKTVKIIERMTLDMLHAADPFLDIVKKVDGGLVRMSQASCNSRDFEVLSDDFVEKSIQFSRGPGLEKARSILQRIYSRELYSLAFSKDYLVFNKTVKKCQEELLEVSKSMQVGDLDVGRDVAVLLRKINMGGGDPLEKAIFNDKKNPGAHYRMSKEMIEKSTVVPSQTSKVTVMIVCRKKGETVVGKVTDLAEEWARTLDETPSVVPAPVNIIKVIDGMDKIRV